MHLSGLFSFCSFCLLVVTSADAIRMLGNERGCAVVGEETALSLLRLAHHQEPVFFVSYDSSSGMNTGNQRRFVMKLELSGKPGFDARCYY